MIIGASSVPNTYGLHGVNKDKNCYFLICYSNITVTSRYQMVRAHTRGALCTHVTHVVVENRDSRLSQRPTSLGMANVLLYLFILLYFIYVIEHH